MLAHFSSVAIAIALFIHNVNGVPATGDIVCRYESTTLANVNYYTCSELALKYRITIEKFFMLNPSVDKECSTIMPNTTYCVAGWLQPPLSTDTFCGPQHGNATCPGLEKQCCNGETWKCGDQIADCQAGTCFSGACEGFPSQYSMDGKCGYQNKNLECGGKWGTCCDRSGKCGTGEAFCGIDKCQSGNCTILYTTRSSTVASTTVSSTRLPSSTPTQGSISPDGSCGGTNKYVCKGSAFGDCCSSSGYCGSTSAHCTAGCQMTFGNCTNPLLSPDGTCGGTNKYTCKGSGFGDCCSSSGYCGSTTGHCTTGCQTAFGSCTTATISPDGTCGGTNKYTCKGSSYGDCCSQYGYCGSTTGHCTTGCQTGFGTCSISTDGTCGGTKGLVCQGSSFGNCCSANGYCGSTVNHCAQGCQNSFSSACMTGTVPSTDGSCGASKAVTCAGGSFDGQCCSSGGWCGTTDGHCKTGCQAGYGLCK